MVGQSPGYSNFLKVKISASGVRGHFYMCHYFEGHCVANSVWLVEHNGLRGNSGR